MANQIRSLGSEEEDEVEKLEADVNQMAQKILEFRTTLPSRIKNALSSDLVAQRPVAPTTHINCQEAPTQSGKEPSPVEQDQDTAEKAQLLKQKISNNFSTMPVLIERMKRCISRFESLESCNGSIHPSFKRKRKG
ncbi:uncharacterized protein LOC127787362 [Diospyros lotus]|uniref:uncharacterized protein LOC127787362 n=1 Tax=Diospyros lotus TaxID=55363 RepID=UPI0022587458|nr:uncharacterized protein LOC127787362 [Diospyros lotus]